MDAKLKIVMIGLLYTGEELPFTNLG